MDVKIKESDIIFKNEEMRDLYRKTITDEEKTIEVSKLMNQLWDVGKQCYIIPDSKQVGKYLNGEMTAVEFYNEYHRKE